MSCKKLLIFLGLFVFAGEERGHAAGEPEAEEAGGEDEEEALGGDRDDEALPGGEPAAGVGPGGVLPRRGCAQGVHHRPRRRSVLAIGVQV